MDSFPFYPSIYLVDENVVNKDEQAVLILNDVKCIHDSNKVYDISVKFRNMIYDDKLEVNTKGLSTDFIIDTLKTYSSGLIKYNIEQQYLEEQIKKINGDNV